ncbi:hypothetical protein BEH94_11985 [Candidatus Altiarchaeales archaeon WOR_SM1_SCG]|nr:hypothetical protein BEH94_11985 [Candidatus Altiarchaeales archaeon WOR_SM1_SCG]
MADPKLNRFMNEEEIASIIREDEKALSEAKESLLVKRDDDLCSCVKYNCLKAFLAVSEETPERLYSSFDFFVKLLDNENAYLRFLAVKVIANLTEVDGQNKFNEIFSKYYSMLGDKTSIVPAQVAGVSGIIVNSKPELEKKITNKLLDVEKLCESRQKELVKGYAVEAFGEYFKKAKEKDRIIEFVKRQKNSESPTTRKKVREFLKREEINI